jgi:hypothetical protein
MDPESSLDAVMNVGIRDGVIKAVSEIPLEGRTTINPAFGGQYSIQLSYGRFCRWRILQTIERHRNVAVRAMEDRTRDSASPGPPRHPP